jgi:hypothetical protein
MDGMNQTLASDSQITSKIIQKQMIAKRKMKKTRIAIGKSLFFIMKADFTSLEIFS